MKKVLFFSYFGFKLKNQIASLFHMYIDMGERIAGKQDRPSLMIEDPLRAPKIIASLFHMYIDMGERIAGKQDRPSLIIEAPPPRTPI